MQQLYPLKFNPIFKDKIWGGNKIHDLLGMNYAPLPNCGEVWLLSSVEGDMSVVSNGFLAENEISELIEVYMGDLVGDAIFEKHGLEFPLLLKIIDAQDKLSVQVHPDDALAEKRHQCNGKTEMWYVMQADAGAELVSGFNRKLDKASYVKSLNEGKIKEILNFETVKKGDVFYIPAGRVHAIGSGILLAEIQQTSDITYRIYDWDRLDDKGIPRELHTELALDALDFTVYPNYKTDYRFPKEGMSTLVKEPFFISNMIHLHHAVEKDYSELDSFVVYLCTDGAFHLKTGDMVTPVAKGECVLIPGLCDQVQIHPEHHTELLEVYIETGA